MMVITIAFLLESNFLPGRQQEKEIKRKGVGFDVVVDDDGDDAKVAVRGSTKQRGT